MVKKVYFNDDAELAISLTKENKILVEIQNGDIGDMCTYQRIELELSDVIEMISDLEKFRKKLLIKRIPISKLD